VRIDISFEHLFKRTSYAFPKLLNCDNGIHAILIKDEIFLDILRLRYLTKPIMAK